MRTKVVMEIIFSVCTCIWMKWCPSGFLDPGVVCVWPALAALLFRCLLKETRRRCRRKRSFSWPLLCLRVRQRRRREWWDVCIHRPVLLSAWTKACVMIDCVCVHLYTETEEHLFCLSQSGSHSRDLLCSSCQHSLLLTCGKRCWFSLWLEWTLVSLLC